MSHADTIVAVSSPPGRSPRGLIRLSGDATRDILATLADASPADRRMIRCRLLGGRLPALLSYFAGPRSYTGQDLAELQTPGHPALLDRLLHDAIAAGARLAEPGEFTFRAYLAGKLDLTQAEGVAATIAAVSDGQLHAASLLREGRLGRWAADLVEELGIALALVEAGIDFTDQDDVVPVTPAQLDARLADLTATLDALLDHSRSWSVIEALPRVVLVGAPSAGKSTLFNALLGHERAVISESPGTTRDLLAEPLRLCGADGREVEVMLVDIAGLDDPRGFIDEQMQATAQQAMRTADLILSVADDDAAFVAADALPPDTPVLRVRTKSDLHGYGSDVDALCISAKTGLHLNELGRCIIARLGERAVSVAGDMLALQPRHERALRETKADLATARALLEPQRKERALAHIELIAGAMRSGLDHLAALGGVMTPDDVIGRVFATFCIGK